MAAIAAAVLLTAGIYPDGHWSAVTKVTTSNFENLVKTEVDSGRTFFVRWIASAG